MTGIVAKSTGKLYKVWLDSNEEVEASLKGGLRLLDIKSTNPVAVGEGSTLIQYPTVGVPFTVA
jgi:ribosome biogenesis GTPase